MKIQSIYIKNLLGVTELSVTPGNITEISGHNGTGKSSILNALRAGLGSSDFTPAQLIREGADEAEVVIVFDSGMSLKRRIRPDGTDVKLSDKDGNAYKKPQTMLDALYTLTQINPLKLLLTDKQSRDNRAETVLSCVPFQITPEDIQGMYPGFDRPLNLTQHGLQVLDALHTVVFDWRTDANREAKRLTTTIDQLESTLPPEDEEAPTIEVQLKDIETSLTEIGEKWYAYDKEFSETKNKKILDSNTELQNKINSAKDVKNAAELAANDAYAEAVQIAKDARVKAMADAEVDFTVAVRNARSVDADVVLTAGAEYTASVNEKRTSFNDRRTTLLAKRAQLEQQSKTEAAITTQRAMLKEQKAEKLTVDLRLVKLNAGLTAIADFRRSKMEKLPAGLSIVNNQLMVGNLAFDQLNTAQRVDIAVQLAALQSGDLRIICVDGCEALDTNTFTSLCETALTYNVQMFCTTVSEYPLKIESPY